MLRAFFPRVAIGCRLSLKIDRNLSPSLAGRGAYPWLHDMIRREEEVQHEYLYRSVVVTDAVGI